MKKDPATQKAEFIAKYRNKSYPPAQMGKKVLLSVIFDKAFHYDANMSGVKETLFTNEEVAESIHIMETTEEGYRSYVAYSRLCSWLEYSYNMAYQMYHIALALSTTASSQARFFCDRLRNDYEELKKGKMSENNIYLTRNVKHSPPILLFGQIQPISDASEHLYAYNTAVNLIIKEVKIPQLKCFLIDVKHLQDVMTGKDSLDATMKKFLEEAPEDKMRRQIAIGHGFVHNTFNGKWTELIYAPFIGDPEAIEEAKKKLKKLRCFLTPTEPNILTLIQHAYGNG